MATPPSLAPALTSLKPARPVEIAGPLRTARLLLRPLVAADREAYIGAARASRAELDPFMPLHKEGETDDQMFDRQLAMVSEEQAQGKCFRCVGVLDDGRIVGGFNLNAISRGLTWQADITCWIATPLAGRGLAVEGIRALCEHGLGDLPGGLGLHEINGWIVRDNPRSIRLAERAGFVKQPDQESYLHTGSRWAMHDRYTRRA